MDRLSLLSSCLFALSAAVASVSAQESVEAAGETTLGSLLDDVVAGYDEHFFIRDREGRFLLEFAAMAQFRYLGSMRERAADQGEFEIATLRPIFKGHAGSERLKYFVQTDFVRDGGTLGLLDWIMSYDLAEDLQFSGGQFRLPFSREQLIGRAVQLGVDRSVVNFALDLGAAGGRSQGVQLDWKPDRWHASLAFSDGVDGTGTAFPNAERSWAVTGRVQRVLAGDRAQFADLTSPVDADFGLQVGAAVHGEDDLFAVTADLHAEWARSVAFVQLTQFDVDRGAQPDRRLRGAVVQAGVRATSEYEAFARFEYGDDSLSSERLRLASIGTNVYFAGQRSKLTAEVTLALDSVDATWASAPLGVLADVPGADGQVVFRLQQQFTF